MVGCLLATGTLTFVSSFVCVPGRNCILAAPSPPAGSGERPQPAAFRCERDARHADAQASQPSWTFFGKLQRVRVDSRLAAEELDGHARPPAIWKDQLRAHYPAAI